MAHVNLHGIKSRLNAELRPLYETGHHGIHVTSVHGAPEHIATQEPRRIKTAAGTL